MPYWLYQTALTAAAPIGAAYLALAPAHRPLLRRFRPNVQSFKSAPVWVQACSVGEVNVARPFLAALRER